MWCGRRNKVFAGLPTRPCYAAMGSGKPYSALVDPAHGYALLGPDRPLYAMMDNGRPC